ncbi:chloride channel protein [Sinobacterium norvegicum]|uniref:chloride channel protein n=1 Tax=Sinobacterium norvegicum TaxID=1641715 RepID=UPI001F2ACFEA|nr:chloride channel protein [Sinobacterium norvegicum]
MFKLPAVNLSSILPARSTHRLLANERALIPYAVLGIITGLATGLIIVLFRSAIEWSSALWLLDSSNVDFSEFTNFRLFLIPAIGALIIGLMMHRLPTEHRASGLSYIVARLHNYNCHIPLKNTLTQFFLGSLALITGQSGGREGPAVHLGAASGVGVGRSLNLPDNSLRILIGCGTAAAIAASFNTPIAGVIFAMEVVIMDYTIAGFSPVILSAVAGTVVSRFFFGAEQFIETPDISVINLFELSWIILLGLTIATASSLFLLIQKYTATLNYLPIWLRFFVAGCFTGGCALLVPEILGISYDSLNNAINGHLVWQSLVMIALFKLATAAVTTAVGMPVGIIGPSLVIGGCIGSLFGLAVEALYPGEHAIELYAILGMGAMMAALLNAPLAALMALLELTFNAHILFPAMLVIVIANICHREIFKQPSAPYNALNQHGVVLRRDPISKSLARVGVSAYMSESIIVLDKSISCARFNQVITDYQYIIFDDSHVLSTAALQPVVADNGLCINLDRLHQRQKASQLDDRASLLRARDGMTQSTTNATVIISEGLAIGVLTLAHIETFLLTPPSQDYR